MPEPIPGENSQPEGTGAGGHSGSQPPTKKRREERRRRSSWVGFNRFEAAETENLGRAVTSPPATSVPSVLSEQAQRSKINHKQPTPTTSKISNRNEKNLLAAAPPNAAAGGNDTSTQQHRDHENNADAPENDANVPAGTGANEDRPVVPRPIIRLVVRLVEFPQNIDWLELNQMGVSRCLEYLYQCSPEYLASASPDTFFRLCSSHLNPWSAAPCDDLVLALIKSPHTPTSWLAYVDPVSGLSSLMLACQKISLEHPQACCELVTSRLTPASVNCISRRGVTALLCVRSESVGLAILEKVGVCAKMICSIDHLYRTSILHVATSRRYKRLCERVLWLMESFGKTSRSPSSLFSSDRAMLGRNTLLNVNQQAGSSSALAQRGVPFAGIGGEASLPTASPRSCGWTAGVVHPAPLLGTLPSDPNDAAARRAQVHAVMERHRAAGTTRGDHGAAEPPSPLNLQQRQERLRRQDQEAAAEWMMRVEAARGQPTLADGRHGTVRPTLAGGACGGAAGTPIFTQPLPRGLVGGALPGGGGGPPRPLPQLGVLSLDDLETTPVVGLHADARSSTAGVASSAAGELSSPQQAAQTGLEAGGTPAPAVQPPPGVLGAGASSAPLHSGSSLQEGIPSAPSSVPPAAGRRTHEESTGDPILDGVQAASSNLKRPLLQHSHEG